MKAFFVATLILLISGCAMTPQSLNDPARSKSDIDVANVGPARQIPYETQAKSGIAVSYNLMYVTAVGIAGYRLTLVLRNESGVSVTFEPRVVLADGAGIMIQPSSYASFVQASALLAKTPTNRKPLSSPPTVVQSSGTITNLTNPLQTYQYTGTTTTGGGAGKYGAIADALSQSLDSGMQEEGLLRLRWAESYWLRGTYSVEPGLAVVGALYFPAASPGPLPLKLVVKVGGQQFEFATARN